MSSIAFIGLGIMGQPMVRNLLKAGHDLHLYARRPEVLTQFANEASIHTNPVEAVGDTDFCITIVSDTPDVEEVILGHNGIIQRAAKNSIVIDMSTISAAATRAIAKKLADKNIHMLDAPVSGGQQGAIDGSLSIMVGGNRDIFEKSLPILQSLGKQITYVGGHGAGQIAKSCNQLLVAQTIIATAEAMEFATAAGVDARQVRKALLGGFAYSKILEVHGLRMLENDFSPGFKSKLHLKDLRITAALAKTMQLHLPGLQRTLKDMQQLVERGDGELDSSALAKIVRQQSSPE